MARLLRIQIAQLKKAGAVWLQYRVAMLLWLLGLIVQSTIYLLVWSAVAEARGGAVGGLDSADFAAYFIILLFVDHLTYTWVMWEYDWRVRQGEISRALLLPMHPINEDIADNIAYKLFGLLVIIPVGFLLTWAFQPAFNFQLWSVLAFVPALLMAFITRFLLGFCVAMVAFWTTRMAAFNRTYSLLVLFLSGRFTPLALLPDWMQALAAILPFRWLLAFPVELMLGQLTPQQALQGLGMLSLWTVATIVLVRFIWSRATRRYAAFGS